MDMLVAILPFHTIRFGSVALSPSLFLILSSIPLALSRFLSLSFANNACE